MRVKTMISRCRIPCFLWVPVLTMAAVLIMATLSSSGSSKATNGWITVSDTEKKITVDDSDYLPDESGVDIADINP